MKNILFLVSLSILLFGCSRNFPTNNIPPKVTFVKEDKPLSQSFSKDDHRYDARYQNFNYDRLGYSNNAGSYYGYYDQRGYFYDNQYYNYSNQYSYDDRYRRRGGFGINGNHNRSYMNNQWNSSHNNHSQPVSTRVYHPREGGIGYGDISYQNSHENVKNRINSRGY